jgi:hypothetical protein
MPGPPVLAQLGEHHTANPQPQPARLKKLNDTNALPSFSRPSSNMSPTLHMRYDRGGQNPTTRSMCLNSGDEIAGCLFHSQPKKWTKGKLTEHLVCWKLAKVVTFLGLFSFSMCSLCHRSSFHFCCPSEAWNRPGPCCCFFTSKQTISNARSLAPIHPF